MLQFLKDPYKYKFDGQTLTKCDFLKGRLPKYFFLKICSPGGKQTIHKVSVASIVKNCHPRTSLIVASWTFDSMTKLITMFGNSAYRFRILRGGKYPTILQGVSLILPYLFNLCLTLIYPFDDLVIQFA